METVPCHVAGALGKAESGTFTPLQRRGGDATSCYRAVSKVSETARLHEKQLDAFTDSIPANSDLKSRSS